jgi:hypothetical protein
MEFAFSAAAVRFSAPPAKNVNSSLPQRSTAGKKRRDFFEFSEELIELLS